MTAGESTSAHVQLLRLPGRGDVEVKDIHREAERGARIRDLSIYQFGADGKADRNSKNPHRQDQQCGPGSERSSGANRPDSRCSLFSHGQHVAPGEERAWRPTETSQILDDTQGGLTVRDGRVEVMLLSVLVDAEAFKGQVPAGSELRLDRSRQEKR